jgi:hypothetical protein
MSKDFIPHQEALELKELGFDEPCLGRWIEPIELLISAPADDEYCQKQHEFTWTALAPLYQQAFRWFREKYDLVHYIDRNDDNMIEYAKFKGVIELLKYRCGYSDGTSHSIKGCHTYEEAELACLKKLIQIVKENKQ